jgi:hypothetical protein
MFSYSLKTRTTYMYINKRNNRGGPCYFMSLVGSFAMLSMLLNTILNGRATDKRLTAKRMEEGATTAETNCYTSICLKGQNCKNIRTVDVTTKF